MRTWHKTVKEGSRAPGRLAFSGALVLAGWAAACADGVAPLPPPPDRAASVIIENRSQYELTELRLHESPDYLEVTNELLLPMAVEEAVVFYGYGSWHATVYREHYRGGPILAFTTAAPVTLEDGAGYRLEVFDQSFRVSDAPWEEPETTELPMIGEPYPASVVER